MTPCPHNKRTDAAIPLLMHCCCGPGAAGSIAPVLDDGRRITLLFSNSNLDTESEYLFQQAIQGLLKDRTAVIIAHRLSTIRNADQILFVKDGHISEQGTHDELMQQKDDYYRFCTVQLMKN